MIRVRILRVTGNGQAGAWGVGELLTLPDDIARDLLNARRAEVILSDPNADAPDSSESGAPAPRSADPKPKRTR